MPQCPNQYIYDKGGAVSRCLAARDAQQWRLSAIPELRRSSELQRCDTISYFSMDSAGLQVRVSRPQQNYDFPRLEQADWCSLDREAGNIQEQILRDRK